MPNVSPSETCYDYFGSFLTNCGELLNRKYKLYRLTEKINSNGIFFIEKSKIVHVFGLGSNVFGNTLFNNFLDDEKVTSDNIVSFVELIWLAFNPVDLKNQDLNPDSVLNAIDLNQLYKKLEEIESFNFYSASTFGIEGMKRFASNTELSKKVFEEAFLKFKKDNQNPELLRDIVDKVLEKACYHNSPGIPLLSFFNFLGFSANIQAKVAFDYCGIKKSDFVNMIELGLKKNLLPFALKHKVLLSSEHSCHSSVIDETVFPLYYLVECVKEIKKIPTELSDKVIAEKVLDVMITDKYSVEDDEKTKQIFDKYLKLKQNFLKLQKLYYVSYCYNPSEKKIKNKLLGVFLRHVLEKIFESIDDNILNTILESTSWQTDLQEDKNIGDRIARIHLIIENISKKICDKKLNQDQIKLDVDIICSLNKIKADLVLAKAKEQPSSDKINANLALAKAKKQPSYAPSCPDAKTCGKFFLYKLKFYK